ncbi:MAG: hypothetical protein IT270_16195 [Saprospiraceae bacterium]|nr:hypothetical protein [Saprospiraceae bacterium]
MKQSALLIPALLLLGGCNHPESRGAVDVVQILLQQDPWLRFLFCVVLALLLFTVYRIFKLGMGVIWRVLKYVYRFFFVWTRRNWLLVGLAGGLLWLFSQPIIDALQDFEQRYLNPSYLNASNGFDDERLISMYEDEMGKHTDTYEKNVVMKRTREMAEKMASSPLAIYETAYLECGLDPFRVRSDKVAAGWIQFTRAGLVGLTYKGKAVRLEEVFAACSRRDINFIMDLSELYLLNQYKRSGSKPLHNTIDLYLAVFAPAHIGAAHDKVVYEGYKNPSYFKNAGLDGWYTESTRDGKQLILRKNAARDGKITIWEIYLALESKKNRLVEKGIRKL